MYRKWLRGLFFLRVFVLLVFPLPQEGCGVGWRRAAAAAAAAISSNQQQSAVAAAAAISSSAPGPKRDKYSRARKYCFVPVKSLYSES
jgi:hypothetical protein